MSALAKASARVIYIKFPFVWRQRANKRPKQAKHFPTGKSEYIPSTACEIWRPLMRSWDYVCYDETAYELMSRLWDIPTSCLTPTMDAEGSIVPSVSSETFLTLFNVHDSTSMWFLETHVRSFALLRCCSNGANRDHSTLITLIFYESTIIL